MNILYKTYPYFFLFGQTTRAALWNETYPKGEVVRVVDLNIYSVGTNNSDLSIIVFYDIRGFNISQTRVFCDRLAAEYHVRVVMPDFFRGAVAPANLSGLETWLAGVGTWSQVSNDLRNIHSWLLSSPPTTQIGLIGFCWGALQVVRGCSNLSTLFFTGVSIHGSQLTADEVRQLQKPVFFIAASNDPPLQPNISSVIDEANIEVGKQCEYKTYSNMRHGFAAAGANYSNPENVEAIDDVHLRVRNFFDKMRKNNSISLSMNFCFTLSFLLFSFYSHF